VRSVIPDGFATVGSALHFYKAGKMKNQNIERVQNVKELHALIMSTMADQSTYFSDSENGWTITSCVQSTGRVGIAVRNAINGTHIDGSALKKGEGATVAPIKLKVLSRQACQVDKDCKPINHASKMFAKEDDADKAANMPTVNTPPVEGDFILIKGDAREVNERGTRMIAAYAAEFEQRHQHEKYKWRNGLRNFYTEYQVDADGCISVSPQDAFTLLSRFGESISFPVFQKESTPLSPGMRARRVITNWLFREVPRNYTEKKQPVEADEIEETAPVARRGRKPKNVETEIEIEE